MQSKPLLSICIPTYNREKYLKECLESIVNQKWFNISDIEIVISDNASTDNTKELVHEYQKKYSNIKYHRNEENIGAIKNVFRLPSHANWEYVWYMSDDDMFSDIALDTITPILKQWSSDFILSRFYWFWNGETIDTKKIRRTGETISLKWMSEFFDFLGRVQYDITSYIMLLSIFCFRKEVFESHTQQLLSIHRKDYIEQLCLDNFIHARIIYMPFGEDKMITIIEKDLVMCRWDNISWSFRFVVCEDLKRLIQDLYQQYKINKKTYWKMKNVYRHSVFSYIVMVHVKRYMPEFLYNSCVYLWRKFFALIRLLRIKLMK